MIQKEKQGTLNKKITRNELLMFMYNLHSREQFAVFEITVDFKACLKRPASSCGLHQVIDTKQRVTPCSTDKKTKKRNEDKTNFLLVYRDGSSQSIKDYFLRYMYCSKWLLLKGGN